MPPRLSSCLPHRRTARFRPSASPASRRLHHHPPRGAGVARVPFCLSRKLIIAASPPPACFKVQPMSPRFLRQFSSLHMWAIRPGPPLNTIVHRSASHIVIVYALISNNAVRFLACAQPPACMLCIVALTVAALLIRVPNGRLSLLTRPNRPALISLCWCIHSHLLDHKTIHNMTYSRTTISNGALLAGLASRLLARSTQENHAARVTAAARGRVTRTLSPSSLRHPASNPIPLRGG